MKNDCEGNLAIKPDYLHPVLQYPQIFSPRILYDFSGSLHPDNSNGYARNTRVRILRFYISAEQYLAYRVILYDANGNGIPVYAGDS